MDFEDPHTIDLTRNEDSKGSHRQASPGVGSVQGMGLHKCPGIEFVDQVCVRTSSYKVITLNAIVGINRRCLRYELLIPVLSLTLSYLMSTAAKNDTQSPGPKASRRRGGSHQGFLCSSKSVCFISLFIHQRHSRTGMLVLDTSHVI